MQTNQLRTHSSELYEKIICILLLKCWKNLIKIKVGRYILGCTYGLGLCLWPTTEMLGP